MNLFRSALKVWAKIGIAPGYLYQVVNKIDERSGNIKLAKVVGGNIVNCDLRDLVQKHIYYFGCYEPIENYLLSQLVKEDSIVLDVGANIGFYSLTLSNHIKTGQIYSFEAVPATYEKLKRNISDSSKDAKVTALNLGAWNIKENVTFSLPDDDNIGAYTAGDVADSNVTTCEATMVPLDSFVKENDISKVDFIKMDIEGAELNALKGAHGILESFKPTILLEVCRITCERFNYTVNDLWELLSSYGYRAYKVGHTPETSYEIENFSDIDQCNVILSTEDLSNYIKNWNYKEIKAHYAQALGLLD